MTVLVTVAVTAILGLSGGPATTNSCTEDMACWSWPRMGNHQRGVFNQHKASVVVGPCRFHRMDRHGRIDWSITEHLHGDRWARKHGCS